MQNTIKDCIFDTIIETNLNAESILVKIGTSDGSVKRLPAADLPLQIRQIDPILKNAAQYVLTPKDSIYEILIGENFLGIKTKQYNNWKDFFNFIKKVYDPLIKENIITNVKRMGLRYINLILDPNITIKYIQDFSENEKILLQREFMGEDNIQCATLTANMVQFDDKIGTIIDITTYKEGIDIKQMELFADKLHAKNKELFEEYAKNE